MATKRKGKAALDRRLLVPVLSADVTSVRSLIAAGADLNVCVPIANRAALWMPAGTGNKTPLAIAITERADEANWLVLSQRKGPASRKRKNEARKKRAALLEIMEELARAGADVNLFSTSNGAQPPLFMAACNNDVEAVELLLRYGARSQGTGALHAAAIKGHLEMVRALLAAGLDTNETAAGLTPLQTLKQRAHSPETESERPFTLNMGPKYEQQEAKREKKRAVRRKQIMQILEANEGTARVG